MVERFRSMERSRKIEYPSIQEIVEVVAHNKPHSREFYIPPSQACRLVDGMYGCSSHIGPEKNAEGKSNEDFSLGLEMRDNRGEVWVVAAVADGVSQSPWSAVGSRLAAMSFAKTVEAVLRTNPDYMMNEYAPEFSKLFTQNWKEALLEAGDQIVSKNYFDSTKYAPEIYRRHAGQLPRQQWFQTSLLGVALGPKGGLGVFPGDGFAQIIRHNNATGQQYENNLHLPFENDEIKDWVRLADNLIPEVVQWYVRTLPDRGADSIEVRLATDGVEKSQGHSLDRIELYDKASCDMYLVDLAESATAEPDNMSVAFARRDLQK